ncbi:cytochrome-c oxidase [Pseudobacillus wudalianchiensis]|uniref:Cytochrome-c oxidase n=1 Tax=Pseudobacillus wudalianchiensis TaxID=1743143 RepID=A0A1B9AYT2_9BACI|nr:cytochrome-c oxidase [Bacillus wudalianchiensis]OCA88946.1 cytochrome-c oxidase [Bacillus wudalianchiensis]
MAIRLIKISAVYFAVGVLLGYYMSVAHSYGFAGVHVHINLLGWTALTLIGILYHLFPALTSNGLAKTHFWLHNLGLPIMMICLFLLIATESQSYTAGIAVGATLTVLGVLAFVLNVLMNLKSNGR